MIRHTKLSAEDKLPLTCSRTGTCCHDKNVSLNPWELICLAKAKGLSSKEFQLQFCDLGGIRMRFIKEKDSKFESTCSQYVDGFGCSVHEGRPLVCRLYPLGRQKQGAETIYMYQGNEFPCLKGCPEVVNLPYLTVGDYIDGQSASSFELMQDTYLEFMQEIADIGFALFLETGLASSDNGTTLSIWRKMGEENPEQLFERIGPEWVSELMTPSVSESVTEGIEFASLHLELLQQKIQESFDTASTVAEIQHASCVTIGLALHLGRGLGVDTKALVNHWVEIAKTHGGLEA